MDFEGLGAPTTKEAAGVCVSPRETSEGPTRAGRERQRSVSSPGLFCWEQEEFRDIVDSETAGQHTLGRDVTVSNLKATTILQRKSSSLLGPPSDKTSKVPRISVASTKSDFLRGPNSEPTKSSGEPHVRSNSMPMSKKLIRIKLPNNSYRTFPVLVDTTVTCVIEKIKAKMAKEKSDCETSSHIFQVNADGSETILDDSVLVFDVLDNAPPTCEFIFKRQGEKIVDRNEELKQIALENRILEKKKENIQEALSTWLGDSKAPTMPSSIISISEKRFPFTSIPFASSSKADAEKINLFMQADILSSLLIEKSSASQRFIHLKKCKGNKAQGIIDFSSDVSIIQRNEVFALSKISEVINYTVMVSGWRCFMKEFFCHANDFSSLKKALFEVTLLDTLPYHPNIIQYFYHIHTERSTQLFYAKHGPSLRHFIEEYQIDHQELPLGVVKTILLALCNALAHLHCYSVIHNHLTSDDVFIRYDKQKEKATQVVLGNFCYSVQTEYPLCTIASTPSPESLTRYSAPELFQENQTFYSQASDIYSLGMICYELLNLEQPYAQYEGKENFLKGMKNRAEKPKCSFDDPTRADFARVYNACVEEGSKHRPTILQLKQMVWNLPDTKLLSQ